MSSNALIPLDPQLRPAQGRLGAIVQAVRKLLLPTTEEPRLPDSDNTAAESRGYADAAIGIEPRTLASWVYEKLKIEAGRAAAWRDYDLMDAEVPEISSALDVVSEFSTQSDDAKAETFKVGSEDQGLQTFLGERVKALKLDQYVTPTAREVAKYGNSYWELIATEDGEITSVKPLPPRSMIRNEDQYGTLMAPNAFTQLSPVDGKPCAQFAAWQIVHFRFRKHVERIYGSGILESIRKNWKQLAMMEDGAVVGLLYRSHVRFAFSFPAEGMGSEAILDYIDKLKAKFKKKKRFNPETMQIEEFQSPMTAEQDIWLPQKKDVKTDVKVLQGQGNFGQVVLILEYFRNKMFAGLKVPKALLGMEEDVNAKATLTTQDLNFARMLRRHQHVMSTGVREVLERDAILQGKPQIVDAEWQVAFPAVSTTDELVQWQTELIKAQVAQIYKMELELVTDQYVYTKFLEMDEDEAEEMAAEVQKQKDDDQQKAADFLKANPQPPPPPMPGNPNAKQPMPNVAAPNAGPKVPQPTKSERDVIFRVRNMFQRDLTEAISVPELKLARLIRNTQRQIDELRQSRHTSALKNGKREMHKLIVSTRAKLDELFEDREERDEA